MKLFLLACALVPLLVCGADDGLATISRANAKRLLALNQELTVELRGQLQAALAEQEGPSVRLKPHLFDRGFIKHSAAVDALLVEWVKADDILTRQLGSQMAWVVMDKASDDLAAALFKVAQGAPGEARDKAYLALSALPPVKLTEPLVQKAREVYAVPESDTYQKIFARKVLEVKDPAFSTRELLARFLAKKITPAEMSSASFFSPDKLTSEETNNLVKRLLEYPKEPSAWEVLSKHYGKRPEVKAFFLENLDRVAAQFSKLTLDILKVSSENDPAFARRLKQTLIKDAQAGKLDRAAVFDAISPADRPELAAAFSEGLSKMGGGEKPGARVLAPLLEWLPYDQTGKLKERLMAAVSQLASAPPSEDYLELVFSSPFERLGDSSLAKEWVTQYLAHADCNKWDEVAPPCYVDSSQVPGCRYLKNRQPTMELMKSILDSSPKLRAKWAACLDARLAKDLTRKRGPSCESVLFGSTMEILSEASKKKLVAQYAGTTDFFDRRKLGESFLPFLKEKDLPLIREHLLSFTKNATLASLIGNVEAVEAHRDLFSPEVAKHLDAEIAAITDSENAPDVSPCDMVCGVRNTAADWTKEELFAQAENRASISEQSFAIKNLIAAFDLKTRGVCPANPAADELLKKFHFSEFPAAIGYLGDPEKASARARGKAVEGLNAVHALGEFVRTVAPKAGPTFKKSLAELENKGRKLVLDEQAEAQASAPGILTNSLVHGLGMGQLFMSSGADVKSAPPGWVEKWNRSYAYYTKDLSSVTGPGGSTYGNYALGLLLEADPNPSAKLVEAAEKAAQKLLGKCNFPYDSRMEPSDTNDSDVYRSVVIWGALVKKGSAALREKYQASLDICLKKYFAEPWGPIHARKNDGEDHHTKGKRKFAPYFYYGTLFAAAEGVVNSKDKGLEKILLRRLQLEWNPEKKLFMESASPMYQARPTYYNPLMAMAALPLCKASKK